jgi:hypothetical protein
MVVLPRITALGALGLVVASELLPHQGPDHGVIVGLGVCAAVALLVTEACQRGIAHRSRPVLSPDLRSADEAIRRMASWSVAYGSAGLITMLAAFEAVLMSQPPVVATTLHGTSAFHDATGYVANAYFPRAICLFGAVLLFFWAVGLAWQARRMVKPWPRSRSQAAAESLA